MKSKILVGLFIAAAILFSTGLTYSIFTSSATMSTNNQKIAKFIFNAEQTDEFLVPINDLVPNTFKEFEFQVSNNSNGQNTNVNLNYQITIKTFHFMPLVIELYKVGVEDAIMVCDESYTRNTDNELVCNSSYQEMRYDKEVIDNYKLKVTFPSEYNGDEYASLVDYIDLSIASFQKVDK